MMSCILEKWEAVNKHKHKHNPREHRESVTVSAELLVYNKKIKPDHFPIYVLLKINIFSDIIRFSHSFCVKDMSIEA